MKGQDGVMQTWLRETRMKCQNEVTLCASYVYIRLPGGEHFSKDTDSREIFFNGVITT